MRRVYVVVYGGHGMPCPYNTNYCNTNTLQHYHTN